MSFRAPIASRRTAIRGWLCVLAIALALAWLPPLRLLEAKLLDLEFALLRSHAPRPEAANVVIVGVDEATLARWPEPIALWHPHLGDLLRGLARAQPRAVGLDLELPERSYDFLRPGSDRELLGGLLAARAAAPLAIALGVDRAGRVKPVHPPFLAAAGEDAAGVAAWPLDPDLRVRRFEERLGEGGASAATFVGTLARRLGAATAPGLIDFGIGERFAFVPAWQVAEWARAGDESELRRAFERRIVLVGAVLPFVDRHALPVALAAWEEDRRAPGVLLHAQALRSLLGAGLVREAPLAAQAALVILGSTLWFAFARVRLGLIALGAFALALGAAALVSLFHGVFLPVAAAAGGGLLAAAARTGRDAWRERLERERLERSFAGYVSPRVLDLILRGELDTAGSGRRRICVLFADIRNFTAMSERAQPEVIVALLSDYFTRMTRAIHAGEGTVDNFRGDGLMCFFGAPEPAADACRRGFEAARRMLAGVEALNAETAARGLPPLRIGISLAYGEAIVGRIGSLERHDYTAIGDVANVCARLEGLTKELGYPLLATAEVVAAANADGFDDLGTRELRGHAPVAVYGWPARVRAAAGLESARVRHG